MASNVGNPDIKTISPITGPCLKPWPEATGAGVQWILSPLGRGLPHAQNGTCEN
jgi:hypothetical protein